MDEYNIKVYKPDDLTLPDNYYCPITNNTAEFDPFISGAPLIILDKPSFINNDSELNKYLEVYRRGIILRGGCLLSISGMYNKYESYNVEYLELNNLLHSYLDNGFIMRNIHLLIRKDNIKYGKVSIRTRTKRIPYYK